MSFLDFLAIVAGYSIGAFLVMGASALCRRLAPWSRKFLATRTSRR